MPNPHPNPNPKWKVSDWMAAQPPEVQREIRGRNSCGKKRKRTQRELLKTILTMDVDDPVRKAVLEALGLDPSFENDILMAQVRNAQQGDTESARYIRDTIGEKPTESYNMAVSKGKGAVDVSKLSDDELMALADSEDEEEPTEEDE